MKILVLGFAKLKYMPYANFYLENIDRLTNEVHLLYWNRDLQEEDMTAFQGITQHEFLYFQEDETAKHSKLKSFMAFRRFAKKILAEQQFDYIVVLTSIPAILLSDVLMTQYKNRFILDYRDSTYEGFWPFKYILGKVAKASRATFISSDAFRRFFPEREQSRIYTTHNLLTDSLNHRDIKRDKALDTGKLRIVQWGLLRYEEINKALIDRVGNDSRFELHYYGREQQTAWNIKEYVRLKQIENVFFHGEYKPEERYDFACQTDILHNIYVGTRNEMMLISNKYYDGMIFRTPQLCIKGSYMAEQVEKNGIGLACDPRDADFVDRVLQYYHTLDHKEFAQNCDRTLDHILEEYYRGQEIIRSL